MQTPETTEPLEHLRALEASANENLDEAVAICREASVRDPAAVWPFEVLGNQLQREVVEALGKERAIVSLRIMSKDGRVLASSDAREIGTSVPRTDPLCVSCHSAPAVPSDSWTEFREIGSGSSRGLELLRPLFAGPSQASRADASLPLGMLQMITALSDIDARRSARHIEALAAGGAACAAVVLLVATLIWYLVRRPLSMLEAAVGRVGAGELDVEIRGEPIDEIGRLNSAFNRMPRDLRRTRYELDDIHHSMEQRIASSTEEIRKANREPVPASR